MECEDFVGRINILLLRNGDGLNKLDLLPQVESSIIANTILRKKIYEMLDFAQVKRGTHERIRASIPRQRVNSCSRMGVGYV